MPRSTGSAPISRSGRGQRQRVAVDDLAVHRLLAQLDQLVAGGEDRDPRPAIDRHGRLAEGGQHADFRRAEDRAGGNDRVAAPHVLPPETDMLGTLHPLLEQDRVVGRFGLLDRDHRVAAGGNGGAGHDPDGASGLDRGSYGSSGRDIAGDPQGSPWPAVVRSHRKAVHGRIVVERHVPRGRHVFGDDPAESRQELNPLHTERRDAGEDHASRDFKGGHNRNSCTLNRGGFQTAATADPAEAGLRPSLLPEGSIRR